MPTLIRYPVLVVRTLFTCLVEALALRLASAELARSAGLAADQASQELDALHLDLFPWEE